MKLNIELIYEKLHTGKTKIFKTEKAGFDLAGIRNYLADADTFSENHLYLISAQQLKAIQTPQPCYFLCIGDIGEANLPNQYKAAICLPDGTKPEKVFAQVQDIFDEYHQWNTEVYNAIFRGESMQTILEISSRFLTNPIALFDNCQTLLMKSGDIPVEEAEGSLWEFVLEHGYSPQEEEAEWINQTFHSQRTPFYYRSSDQYQHINRLLAGIYHNDKFFGGLAISDITAPISETEYANMVFIQKIMENALLRSTEYQNYLSDIPWYLTQLLKGRTVEESIVSYHLSTIGQKIDDPYYLWVLSPQKEKLTEYYDAEEYLPSIGVQFQPAQVYRFENYILVIDFQVDEHQDAAFIQTLKDFLTVSGFNAGCSMTFNHLMDVHQAFLQCTIALEGITENETELFFFKERYSEHILQCIQNNSDAKALIYPGIQKLLDNEAYGRELLQCLQTYMFNGQNISAAARSLFIHRHTVLYRLEVIEKITGIDFEDLDEDTRLQIYLSCRLLLE